MHDAHLVRKYFRREASPGEQSKNFIVEYPYTLVLRLRMSYTDKVRQYVAAWLIPGTDQFQVYSRPNYPVNTKQFDMPRKIARQMPSVKTSMFAEHFSSDVHRCLTSLLVAFKGRDHTDPLDNQLVMDAIENFNKAYEHCDQEEFLEYLDRNRHLIKALADQEDSLDLPEDLIIKMMEERLS